MQKFWQKHKQADSIHSNNVKAVLMIFVEMHEPI